MFGVSGSSDPVCLALAMPSPLLSEGIVVSEATAVWEATAILEARRWHYKRAAPSGWSMAPDASYLSSLGGLAISNSQGCGHNLCKLRLVAFHCGRMVDER